MSGLAAEVLNRMGATTVNIPGGEVMSSFQIRRSRCCGVGRALDGFSLWIS